MSQATCPGRFFWTSGQSRENEMIVVGNLSFGGGFFGTQKQVMIKSKLRFPRPDWGISHPFFSMTCKSAIWM